jgi:hypothetical protein
VPGRWSVAGLVLAALGVVASIWIVVSLDSDPSSVLWPLVVLPVAVGLVPVVLPSSPTRIGAAVAMAAWCIVTGLSIGVVLVPALAALLVAIARESP